MCYSTEHHIKCKSLSYKVKYKYYFELVFSSIFLGAKWNLLTFSVNNYIINDYKYVLTLIHIEPNSFKVFFSNKTP